ncbi:MAG: D-hexose-6-phosphate mutarotase [Hydrogenovibrio sp.]
MQTLETLQTDFAVDGVRFYQQDQLVMVEVVNTAAKAVLTTHGGSVLSFTPLGEGTSQQDWLWVSDTAVYHGKKPVRGGIPVCWPWFGAAEKDGLPAHGFVRNKVWDLVSVTALSPAETRIELRFATSFETLSLWPQVFELRLTVTVGETLTLALATLNPTDKPFEITEAFHSYFSVSNAPDVWVDGLQGSERHDKLTHAEPVTQTESLAIQPPIDSVFLNQPGLVKINDSGLGRCLCIEKESAQSSVVWNPGAEIVKGFADMNDQAWPEMLCVEAGNVLDNAVTIAPKTEHVLRMVISETPL